jgi:hypothetical protein
MSSRFFISFLALMTFGHLAARTLEFETNEVTQPGITLAPDGRSLIFNLLGHLYRLPSSGGSTTQLTFGPYYDSEPASHLSRTATTEATETSSFSMWRAARSLS